MTGPTRGQNGGRDRFDELVAAYALGALTGEERLWFEAYLAEHPELSQEVDELASVANLLALAPAEQEPPPTLRRNILESIGAPPEVAAVAPARRTGGGSGTSWIFRPSVLAAAAALVAVVALTIWNFSLRDENGDLRAQNGSLQGQITERRAVELRSSGPASGADGEVLLRGRDRAVLVAGQLPPAPEGKVYETWIIQDGVPKPAGLFESQDGTAALAVEGSLRGADAVAVTLEPEGGSPMPTSTPILQATLDA